MRAMRAGRVELRTAGAAIAALLVLIVVLSPVLLGGETPSSFELLVLALGVLGLGLLLRWRGTAHARTLGSALVMLGVVSLAIVVGLIWLLLEGWGRPY
jgi:drug/metabolite transporter (DMT)-like permease